jgi:hypothetical protein
MDKRAATGFVEGQVRSNRPFGLCVAPRRDLSSTFSDDGSVMPGIARAFNA